MHSRTLYDRDLRRKLLGTASAVALLALTQTPEQAHAQDSGQHIWLDLTGQYDMNSGKRTVYGEPFDNGSEDHQFFPLIGQKAGGDGTIGLTLQEDEWYFNLAFNYGRTGTSRAEFSSSYDTYKYRSTVKIGRYHHYADGEARHNESHKMLDFTIGQDVGLGMFGMDGTSILSAGVRWANFDATTIGRFFYGENKYSYPGGSFLYNVYNTEFNREVHQTFNGIGPMISWKGSTPLADPAWSFEWGASAAILFGPHSIHGFNAPDWSRNASVPQAGGYLGIGWHCPDWPLKLTAGYNINASWNVLPQVTDTDERRRGLDRITQGPFLRATIQVE